MKIDNEPEFSPGDCVMILCPAGPPPWPEGPANVKAILTYNEKTEESTYVIEMDNGHVRVVDGVELVAATAWIEWMQRHAN